MKSANVEEQRCRVASLLETVADGKVSPAEALARAEEWRDIPWSESFFSDAYHALRHFEADSDIRANDADYALAQVAWLKSFAEKLLKIN